MKQSRKKPLPLLVMHRKHNNRVMDSSVRSSNNHDNEGRVGDALPEMAVVPPFGNINNSSDQNEETSVTSKEFSIDSFDTNELKENYSEINSESFESRHVTYHGIPKESITQRLSKFEKEEYSPKLHRNKIKKYVNLLISSLVFRIFGILLIFLDVTLVIVDMFITDPSRYIPVEYRSVCFSIALFFLLDLILRVYVDGIMHYFSDALNSLDAIIVIVALGVDTVYLFYDFKFLKDLPRLAVLFRPLRLIMLIRIFHLAYQKRQLEMVTRRIVSGNKRRYRKDGFDLDLTYVTERIIAMSFPSSGKESFYRNPMTEVVRFLDIKHQDHYLVYNLCSERAYDPKYFHFRVHRIKIEDHNVPTLSEMIDFCKEVDRWLTQDEENIVVVHCKGGKGRTGTMICAYLIASEIFFTAEDSLYYFGERRTDKTTSSKYQGVETPSQHRYVGYFADLKNMYSLNLPPRKLLFLRKIVIYSIHGVGNGNGTDLNLQIAMQQKTFYLYSSLKNFRLFHDVEADQIVIKPVNCPLLYDDVKVQFYSTSDLPKFYNNCPFFFWFHTSFVRNSRLYLPRNQLDNPHRPKTWKIYREKFAVELHFDEVNDDLL
ncbi:phosphatidylinositol 3,4,5-trisphosphate 3-phosphatase TPTE2-like [Erinaceus europaeus]|uniref:Phosphatidylinositol 3,4,5-trisphosphate 3-phosphatase TPTE2-like n=1 Tax=Erinaceus europaeus TaxID=9365 RepID=A0ABM3XKZ7_ERIEU|nr:phosphatidylinositol 3,4,5-trisphosphate 3-phosphatase TPTE2-like [Erinaceus europaeus]